MSDPKVVYDHPDFVRENIRFLAGQNTEEDAEQLAKLALALFDDLEAAYTRIEVAYRRLDELTTDDGRHIIEFRETGWTLQHPLSCRPDLFDCAVNRAAERDLDVAPVLLGRFECDISEGGGRFLMGASVDGYDTSTVEDRRIQTDPPPRLTGEDGTR